jgi:hypothetical protein
MLRAFRYTAPAAQCLAMNCACIGMASTHAATTVFTLSTKPAIS